MWPQFHALLLLRWYLFKNTVLRSKRWYFLLLPVALLLGIAFVIFLIVMGFAGGMFLFDVQHPLRTLFIMDVPVFLVIYLWFLSIAMEIQLHRVVDLRTLGYLPVHLFKLFVLNFAQFNMNLISVIFGASMLGLVVALGVLVGVKAFCLGAVLALAWYGMISAWFYFLQGWLHHMMNEKFVQLLLTLISFFFIIPYFAGIYLKDLVLTPEQIETYAPMLEGASSWLPQAVHAVIPLGLMPLGMYFILLGHFLLPLACVAGLLVTAVPGMWLAYRDTRKVFMGRVTRKKARPTRQRKHAKDAPMTLKTFPGMSEELSVLTVAVGLCFWRNSRLKWGALSSLLFIGVYLGFMIAGPMNGQSAFFAEWNLMFIIPMCMFGCMAMMNNLFGTDGDGFGAMVLLPGARWHYLCAYNLIFALFSACIGAVLMILLMVAGMAGAGETLLALVLLLQAYLLAACIGNYFSVFIPYRIEPQKIAQNMGGLKMVFWIYVQLAVFVLMLLPTVACFLLYKLEIAGMSDFSFSPAVLLSVFLLMGSVVLYARFGLKHCGQLLQEREQNMVATLGISTE